MPRVQRLVNSALCLKMCSQSGKGRSGKSGAASFPAPKSKRRTIANYPLKLLL